MSVVPNNVTDSDYSVLIGYYLDCVTSRIVLWAGHRGRRLDQRIKHFFKICNNSSIPDQKLLLHNKALSNWHTAVFVSIETC